MTFISNTAKMKGIRKVFSQEEKGVFMSSKNNSGRPPVLLRLPLRLLSLIASILLVVSLLATVLLLDLRMLISSDNLKGILTEIASLTTESESQTEPSAQVKPQAVRLSAVTRTSATAQGGSLANSGGIADLMENLLSDVLGEEVNIKAEDVTRLLTESTFMDYLAEKAAGYAQDILKGTETTLITTEELMSLLDENQTLLEEVLQMKITDEQKTEIEAQVERIVEEEDLNGTIRNNVQTAMEETIYIPGLGEMTVSELMGTIMELTQSKYLALAIGLCLALMAALLLLSYYNLPAGLRRCGAACMTVGVPLGVIQLVIGVGGNLLTGILGEKQLISSLQAAVAPLAPIHYGLPLVGIAVVFVARMWRIFLPKNED